jgi:hypothetical protein
MQRPILAWVVPVESGGRPDQGLPGYGRPDQGLPGYGHPDQGLPGYGHPDQGLPGYGHPGNRPPGSWGGPVDPGWGQGGGRPDQGLPGYGHPGNRPPGSGMPPMPGQGLPPEFGGRPDQGLPGAQPGPDQGLPGRPDYGTGQPIVPGATPMGSAVATAPPDKVDAEKGAWILVSVQGTLVWAWAQAPKQPVAPDNTLPGTPPPTAGTPLPPTATPKK